MLKFVYFIFFEIILFFLFKQNGQRFDTNSVHEGSTNKLETNGYGVSGNSQQQMYTSTNNQGELNRYKTSKRNNDF